MAKDRHNHLQKKLTLTPRMNRVMKQYVNRNGGTETEALRELINEGINKKWITEKDLQDYLSANVGTAK